MGDAAKAGHRPGPLAGVKAMFLADLGATVIRVDRKQPSGLGAPRPVQFDLGLRNRKSIRVDLKDPAAVEMVLELLGQADALIEGFRPGVMERLGLGPDACLARNPRLVYGRVTGWGQEGPLARAARCTWPLACWPAYWRRAGPARARWSMPPWWMGSLRS